MVTRRNRLFGAIVLSTNLTFFPEDARHTGWVSGDYRNRRITLRMYGEPLLFQLTTPRLRVDVSMADTALAQFDVKPRWFFTDRSTLTGNKNFDGRYSLLAQPQSAAAEIIGANDGLRIRLMTLKLMRVEYRLDGLRFEGLAYQRDVDHYLRLLDVMCELATALESYQG